MHTHLDIGDALYESTMKHTLLPMGIIAAQSFIMLVLFVALYRKLSPGGWSIDKSAEENFEMDTLELTDKSDSEEEVEGGGTEIDNFVKL